MARYTLRVILVLALICAAGMGFRIWVSRMVCETEQKLKIELSGARFEVEDVSCDTLAKDEHIKVYAQQIPRKGSWFFSGWRNRRTLLFEYDPGRWDNPVPAITRPSASTILISVPEVSSIAYQSYKWGDISVTYNIGRVDYPASSK